MPVNKIFQKSITLGNIIQIGVLIIGGAVGYNKLEWRISQLEEVKLETKSLIETSNREYKEAQTKLSETVSKLSEAVTKLIVMEEMRQRQEIKK